MNKSKYIAAACNIIGLLLLVIVVVMCIPLAVPRLLGYQAYAIVSGSMEPELPVGSIVFAKQTEPEMIEAGDIIVFYGGHDSDTVVTHRVEENRTDEREFVTKGDANADHDVNPVSYGNLIGKVVFDLPGIGKFLPVLSGFRGKIYMICIIVAAVLLRIVGKSLSSGENVDD